MLGSPHRLQSLSSSCARMRACRPAARREQSLALSPPIAHAPSAARSLSMQDIRSCNGGSPALAPLPEGSSSSPTVLYSATQSHASWPVAVDATAAVVALPPGKAGAGAKQLRQGTPGKAQQDGDEGSASGSGGGWGDDVIQVCHTSTPSSIPAIFHC